MLELLWDTVRPDKFIDSFCDPQFVKEDFKGALGAFTPCFTDIVILGTAHVCAVLLTIARLLFVRRQCRYQPYRLHGLARVMQCSAIVASLVCLLVELFQLNARIAADPTPLIQGDIAPFEWAEYALSAVTWLLFTVAFICELDRFVPHRTWLLRFPILLIFAGEIAKFRFVLMLAEQHDYFFVLYIINFAAEGWLAILALFHYPSEDNMEALPDDPNNPELPSSAPADETICPEATANIFSTITFSWVGGLMKKGYKKPLQFEDMWKLPPQDEVSNIASSFERAWQRELTKKRPSLLMALWKTTWWLFVSALPFKLVNDGATFIGPIFLNLLLGVVSSGQSYTLGYTYAALMFVGLVTGTLCDNQHFQRVMRAGYQLRALLVHETFKKVLYIAPSARAEFSSGRVFNLVTSDAETLQMLCQNIMGLISSPLRITVAMVMLYLELGFSSLVAFCVLLLLMPTQAYLVRIGVRLQKEALQFTDERGKLEGELLNGIDVVKCNSWEWSMWDRIQAVRNQELGTLWRSFIVQALFGFTLNTIPVLVSVLTFGVYVLLGNKLTAAEAFTSLALFTVLRMPLFQLPQLITQLVNARVALNRLQEFLSAPQQPPARALPPAEPGEAAVRVAGEFTWDRAAPASLVDIDLSVPAGALVAVVGQTGSGKSSLLSAALNLMQQVHGPDVVVRGKVAYIPQAAFIYNATVRENILFGQPFEEERYQRAIEAAALGPDLAQLSAGDLTELGDRGVNVSGGQKQRISLARATYADADVILLDDPLSALDAQVAREVFNKCLMGELRNKTRILVTNQLQFVSPADTAIFMCGGQIAEIGSYSSLMSRGKSFAQLMSQAEAEQDGEKVKEASDVANAAFEGGTAPNGAAAPRETPPPALKDKASGKDGQLTEKEARATGRISLKVLNFYINAMGGKLRFSILMSWFVIVEAARVSATVWLSYWTDTVDQPGGAPHGPLWYLMIYTIISGIQVLFVLMSQFLLKSLSLAAARSLHNCMLRQLLRAPMAFFHTTPLGRIINRLTKDTVDADKNLADFAAFFLRSLLQLASTIVLIGVVTPFALPALVPILLVFYFLYQYFQASVREVKRLDSISRSPVYSSIGEALAGLATIRAFRAEQRLCARNADLVDNSVVMSLVNMSMNRWLSVRLETLGALAALAAAVLTVEQRGAASTFGLVLSYALSITMLTSMTVRLASVAENAFNAVERISEFCDLPQEAPEEIRYTKPDGWPDKGRVEFNGVQMRYRDGLPLVLKGLSVQIAAGSRCGVVGRTGAGKSSLINCLFRLQELCGGSIVIDCVDIAKMGLKQLRSSMAIIPQVPVLFTGTLRFNLTPFGEHSDAECWAALRRAHLSEMVEATPLGLDLVLSEGGAPLSAGQKQLVALARALLRHSKILVMDEATANVDVETDALIQKTVREEFESCTLIAIAHRLHTIIDADQVVVMDRGTAAESGRPADLLANPEGVFSSMVAETGEATARFLRSIAEGELDQREAINEQAAKGLQRVRSVKPDESGRPDKGACRIASHELIEKARGAESLLQACLSALSNEADAADVRERLGLLPVEEEDGKKKDANAVHKALLQALQLVSDVHTLADQVRAKCGTKTPDASGALTPRYSLNSPSEDQFLEGPSSSGVPARGASAPSGNGGYLRSQSLDIPRAEPGSATARRLNLLRSLKEKNDGKPNREEYNRLASEDPSLANDPSLH
ncbi:g8451 [Coccomyxa elongata]